MPESGNERPRGQTVGFWRGFGKTAAVLGTGAMNGAPAKPAGLAGKRRTPEAMSLFPLLRAGKAIGGGWFDVQGG